MKRLGWLPVSEGDFLTRESTGERQWNQVSQKLQGLTIEADKLGAMVNALRRLLDEADRTGIGEDPTMQCETLIRIQGLLMLSVSLRFLQLVRRQVEQHLVVQRGQHCRFVDCLDGGGPLTSSQGSRLG